MRTPPAPTTLDDHLATRLLHHRVVVLDGFVDDAVAGRVCAQLLLLSAEDPAAEVALFISSPGGSATAGLAVHDTMRLLPDDVVTVGSGLVAGIGQLLLAAGTPGRRHALPHARVTMHQPSADDGPGVDVATRAANLAHTRGVVHELTARYTSRTTQQVAADGDRWFTADEAVGYGLVDRVVESVGDVLPGAAGRRVGL